MRGVELAGRLVAAYHGVRRVPANDYSYAQPLKKFLEAFILATRPEGGLHVVLPPDVPGGPAIDAYHGASLPITGIEEVDRYRESLLRPPAGRTWNFYGLLEGKVARVGLHSYVDEQARPWSPGHLHGTVASGDVGLLDPRRDAFRNPYVVGRARGLVWWPSPLWSHCGAEQSWPARWAWECIQGSYPWRWRHEMRHTEQLYLPSERDEVIVENPKSRFDETRLRRLRDVANIANEVYPEYAPVPDYIPLHAFAIKDAGPKRSWLGLLSYYLMEDPQGPGLPAEQVRKALGAGNRRHITRALSDFLEAHPELKRWPNAHRDHGPRIRVASQDSTSHH